MPLAQLVFVTCGFALAHAALAQPFNLPVASTWQISTNNGATWNSGETQVPLSTTSVRVRLQVSWTPPVPDSFAYFTGASFDGYVRGLGGSGAADSVSNITMLMNGQMSPAPPAIAGRRISVDLIKIDPGDSQPLGQGQAVTVFNSPLTFITFGTPIVVFDYRLQLDGSSGTREVGLVYGTNTAPGVVTTLPAGFTTLQIQTLMQPATLVVVPSPAGLAVLGVASGVLLRRRRGM